MKEKRIKAAIQDALGNEHTKLSFDTIWEKSQIIKSKEVPKRVNRKKVIAIVAIAATLMTTTLSAQYLLRVDDISYTFRLDQNVVGTWKTVDFVENEKMFAPNKRSWDGEGYLQELTFCSNGDLIQVVQDKRGSITSNYEQGWTKGHIVNRINETNSAYTIKKIDGEKYMFYEWKSGDYTYKRLEKPYLYVLKQAEDVPILDKAPELVQVKRDDTNIPFVNNDAMKGIWKSINVIDEIQAFNPNDKQEENLFIKSMELKENGEIITKFKDGSLVESEEIYWSQDMVVNQYEDTVSKCIIKEIEGETYMFYEFKNGDYIFNGARPLYYVMKKQ